MKQLLALKVEFKKLTGQDYKPGAPPTSPAPTPSAPAATATGGANGIYERVSQQGELVRKLKSEKAAKVRSDTCWHIVVSLLLILCSFVSIILPLFGFYSPMHHCIGKLSLYMSVGNRRALKGTRDEN